METYYGPAAPVSLGPDTEYHQWFQGKPMQEIHLQSEVVVTQTVEVEELEARFVPVAFLQRTCQQVVHQP